jgi:hypothetical protein
MIDSLKFTPFFKFKIPTNFLTSLKLQRILNLKIRDLSILKKIQFTGNTDRPFTLKLQRELMFIRLNFPEEKTVPTAINFKYLTVEWISAISARTD